MYGVPPSPDLTDYLCGCDVFILLLWPIFLGLLPTRYGPILKLILSLVLQYSLLQPSLRLLINDELRRTTTRLVAYTRYKAKGKA